MLKHWFALSGPAGTGKTTLMYEAVACLRELSIEAVGVTERVRLMPKVTHKELSTDPELHVSLMEAQLAIEQELESRSETQVIVLDRCLLDYLVLAELSFPDVNFRKPLSDLLQGRSFDEYLVKFHRIFVPTQLLGSTYESAKVRPDNTFRLKSIEAFDQAFAKLPISGSSRIFKIDESTSLRERCVVVTNSILSAMCRSDVFRDWYLLSTVAKTLVDMLNLSGIHTDNVWVSGSHCSKSPTLPSFHSDIDLFVDVRKGGSSSDLLTDVLDKPDNWLTNKLTMASSLIKSLYGVYVSITPVTNEWAETVNLKEVVWQTELQAKTQ